MLQKIGAEMSKRRKRYMSLKGKLIMTSLSIVFALSVALVGVYATTTYNRNVNLTATANFIAVDISARVYIEAYRYNTGGTATNYSSSVSGASYDSSVGKYYIDVGNAESVEDALKKKNVTLPVPNSGKFSAATVTLPEEFGFETVASEYMYYKFTVVNIGDTDIHMEVDDNANAGIGNVTCRYAYNVGTGRQLSRSNGFDIISAYTKSNNSDSVPAADTGTADGEGTFSMVAYLTDPSLSSITVASGIKVPVLLRSIKYEYGKNNVTSINLTVGSDVKIQNLRVNIATASTYNGTYNSGTTYYYNENTKKLESSLPTNTEISGNAETMYLDIWTSSMWTNPGVKVTVTCANKTAEYGISAQFLQTGSSRNGGWSEFTGNCYEAVANMNKDSISSGKSISYARKLEYNTSGGFSNFCFNLNIEKIDGTTTESGCSTSASGRYVAEPTAANQPIPSYYLTGGVKYVIYKIATGGSGTSWLKGTLSNGTLPNNITEIGMAAFANCTLSSIVIPSSVIEIGMDAFRESTPVVVDIAGSVHSIGANAFANSVGQSNRWYLVLRNGISQIESNAFGVNLNDSGGTAGEHSKLHEVKIGSSVRSIGDNAFSEYDTNVQDPYAGYMVYAFSPTTTFGFSNAEYFRLGMQSGVGTSIIQKLDSNLNVININDTSNNSNTLMTTIVATLYAGNFKLQADSLPSVAKDGRFSGITIGDTVTIIADSTFQECTQATTLTFPSASSENLVTIGDSAFEGCENITSGVTIPNSVTTLGINAFKDCTYISSIDVSNLNSGITTIPEGIFYGCSHASGTLTIPSSVTIIDDEAFRGCALISGITFNTQSGTGAYRIQSINRDAFHGCGNISIFTIHDSITAIGSSAFEACGKLRTVVVDNTFTTSFKYQSSVGYILSNAKDVFIPNGASTEGSAYLKDVFEKMFDDDVDADENYMFNTSFSKYDYTVWSSKLEMLWTDVLNFYTGVDTEHLRVSAKSGISGHVRIPTTVRRNGINGVDCIVAEISSSGFSNRTNITSVYLPKKLEKVGDYGFNNCTGITKIFNIFPDTFTTIGSYAFYNCNAMRANVILPDELTVISNNAFYNCTSIDSFKTYAPNLTVGNYAFYYCGCSSFSRYAKDENNNYSLASALELITPGKYSFEHCYIGCNVNVKGSIGERAFYATNTTPTGARKIFVNRISAETWSESVSIGDSAFANNPGIDEIRINTRYVSFGTTVFASMSSLTDIYYTNSPAAWDDLSRADSTTKRSGYLTGSNTDTLASNNSVTIHFVGSNVIFNFQHYTKVSGDRDIQVGFTDDLRTYTLQPEVGYVFPSSVTVSPSTALVDDSWDPVNGTIQLYINSGQDITVTIDMISGSGRTITFNLSQRDIPNRSYFDSLYASICFYNTTTGAYRFITQGIAIPYGGSTVTVTDAVTGVGYYMVFRSKNNFSSGECQGTILTGETAWTNNPEPDQSSNVIVDTDDGAISRWINNTYYEAYTHCKVYVNANSLSATINLQCGAAVGTTPTLTIYHANTTAYLINNGVETLAPSTVLIRTDETLQIKYVANSGYSLPDSAITSSCSATLDRSTGIVTVSNVTGLSPHVNVPGCMEYTLTITPNNHVSVVSENVQTTIKDYEEVDISFKANGSGWYLPLTSSGVSVTNATIKSWTYNNYSNTAVLIIKNATGNVTVTVTPVEQKTATISATNVNSSSGSSATFVPGRSVTLTFTKSGNYTLPSSVTVVTSPGGSNVSRVWRVSGSTGTLTFTGPNSDVTITVTGSTTYNLSITKNDCDISDIDGEEDKIRINGTTTITFTADSGYVFQSNSASVSNNVTKSWDASTGTLTLSNPTGNVSVTVTAYRQYNISVSFPGSTAQWSGSQVTSIMSNGSATLTFGVVGSSSEYAFSNDSVTVTGTVTKTWNKASGTLTLSNPSSDVAIEVVAYRYYSIDTSLSNNVTKTGDSIIFENGTATLTFAAVNSNYILPNRSDINVTSGGIAIPSANWTWNASTGVMTISNPTGNISVEVDADRLYTITVTASGVYDNGEIRSIRAGHAVELVFYPSDAYYALPNSVIVQVGGSTVMGSTYYTWTKGSSSGTLRLTEAINGNVVITIAGEGTAFTVSAGTLSNVSPAPALPTTIRHGQTLSITFTPTTHYTLPDSVTVTMGGSTVSTTYYTWTKSTGVLLLKSNITGNVTISMTATAPAPTKYTVSVDSTSSGIAGGWIELYDGNTKTYYFDHWSSVTSYSNVTRLRLTIDYDTLYYKINGTGAELSFYRGCSDDDGDGYLNLTANIQLTRIEYNDPGGGGMCVLSDTEIDVWDDKKKRWKRKKIKDLRPEDKIRVWNFDEGREDVADILWLQEPLNAERYTRVTFSDGGILEVVGPGDHKRHAIFVKETGRFEYINKGLIGKTVVNDKGEDVKITNVEFVDKSVEYYNIVTSRHFNCYTNGYLTSTTLSNIYPVQDMKYVKDGRTEIKIGGLDAYEQMMYDGLRMGERRIGKGGIQSEMDRMTKRLRTVMTKSTDKRIREIVAAWMLAQKTNK